MNEIEFIDKIEKSIFSTDPKWYKTESDDPVQKALTYGFMSAMMEMTVRLETLKKEYERRVEKMSPYPTSKEIMNDQYNSGYAAGYDKGYMNGRVQGINTGKSCIIKKIYELIDKYPNMTDCMYEVIRLLHEETEKIDD